MPKDPTPCGKYHFICASGSCTQPERLDCKGCSQLVRFTCHNCPINPCYLVKEKTDA